MKYLTQWLIEHADNQHYLFTLQDLRALLSDMSDSAFKTLLSRVVQHKLLVRVCRGVYLYKKAYSDDGLLLFHTAALLRANMFNYISLETALSDAGVISQMPFNWVTIMSSGRSNQISCGDFGTIEFVHTEQNPSDLAENLFYDLDCGMWRANVKLALRDMKVTHRNCDLIDWEIANELI